MTRTLLLFVALVLAGTLAATCAHAQEESANFDIGPKFRAKIAKEKSKQAAKEAANGSARGTNGSGDNAQCGAQNIGNVETSGRPGTAPREVFVFAPNAINLVSTNGCN